MYEGHTRAKNIASAGSYDLPAPADYPTVGETRDSFGNSFTGCLIRRLLAHKLGGKALRNRNFCIWSHEKICPYYFLTYEDRRLAGLWNISANLCKDRSLGGMVKYSYWPKRGTDWERDLRQAALSFRPCKAKNGTANVREIIVSTTSFNYGHHYT